MNVILDQARLLLEQGRPKDAESKIKAYLQGDPDNHYALSLLARCLYDRKALDDGISIIRQAIRIEPDESFYYYLHAFGHYQKGDYPTATANLSTAIRLNPYHPEYYGLLAFVYLADKSFKSALAKATEGLAIEADNITCLNARAMALNKLKQPGEAMATMQNALARDPDNDFTHNTLGWTLLERGKHREAAAHFREALRINPVMGSAQQGLKEALKSRIPPYRWLLQYAFWVNNQGKRLKSAMPLIIYISFRIIILVFKKNRVTEDLAWVAAGMYVLFVIGSWTMNSIANFFLLFHPDGKYALTSTERWSAIAVVSTMAAGFTLIALVLLKDIGKGTAYEDAFFAIGMALLSLALPLGEMDYPVRIRKANRRNLFSVALTAAGLASILLSVLIPAHALFILLSYGIAFLLYNWSGALRYK